jgi:hypothetical protein
MNQTTKTTFTVLALVMMLCFSHSQLSAQEQTPESKTPAAIEDNSFLIEEAFNQENRVVQHISNATYFSSPTKNIAYTFTQEWPVGSQMHQFSFSVPYLFLNSNANNGIGDVMINYRFQATGKEQWITLAPRISLIIATGSEERETGMGTAGIQMNIPASKYLSDKFIVHFNLGTTLFPNVKAQKIDGNEVQKTLQWFNMGGSVIWLAKPEFNIMLECGENFTSGIDENGGIEHTGQFFLNPGMRYALNISELQIVPGLGFPIMISKDNTQGGLFLYLSFEHPF